MFLYTTFADFNFVGFSCLLSEYHIKEIQINETMAPSLTFLNEGMNFVYNDEILNTDYLFRHHELV